MCNGDGLLSFFSFRTKKSQVIFPLVERRDMMQLIKFAVYVANSTVAIYNLSKVIGGALCERDKQRASDKAKK